MRGGEREDNIPRAQISWRAPETSIMLHGAKLLSIYFTFNTVLATASRAQGSLHTVKGSLLARLTFLQS